MLRWGVGANRGRTTLLVVACVVALVGCGDDDESATTSTTSSTTSSSTTSTTSEPRTPEEEVEAAYLRSWEVYAKAVRDLDPTGLEEAYAEEALSAVRREVMRRRGDMTPVRVEVEHDFVIQVLQSKDEAVVVDQYVNRSVKLDERTGEPVEPEVATTENETYQLRTLGGRWKVVRITRSE